MHEDSSRGTMISKTDPQYWLRFSEEDAKRQLAELKCPMWIIFGGRSHVMENKHAALLCAQATHLSDEQKNSAALPHGSHFLVPDHAQELLPLFVQAAERVEAENARHANSPRRPESLNIRPLPQFATLEEAKRALGPRKIPTKEMIEV